MLRACGCGIHVLASRARGEVAPWRKGTTTAATCTTDAENGTKKKGTPRDLPFAGDMGRPFWNSGTGDALRSISPRRGLQESARHGSGSPVSPTHASSDSVPKPHRWPASLKRHSGIPPDAIIDVQLICCTTITNFTVPLFV